MNDSKYGYCVICGYNLYPVWFTEYEAIENIKTGRYRKACSHLECINCWHKEAVDDTFDDSWINNIIH